MKKIYIQPTCMIVKIGVTSLICGSKDITSAEGIDYGGVDEEGLVEPSSREFDLDWDEEADFDE